MARTIVTRRAVVGVSRAAVTAIPARSNAPFDRGGSEPDTRLGISMYVFHTWDLNDPTNYSYTKVWSSPFLRGYNWQTWKNAITARIQARGGNPAQEIQEDNGTNTVIFLGLAVFDAASMCDRVQVRIGTPLEHIQEIKARSRVGTKVYMGLFNFESINQGHGYTAHEEAFTVASRNYILTAGTPGCSANLNAYGCTCIDKYEHTIPDDITSGIGTCSAVFVAGRVACPHTPNHAGLPLWGTATKHSFDCDVRSNAYILALMGPTGVSKSRDVYYLSGENLVIEQEGQESATMQGVASYDGQVWDNGLEDPFDGSAKNSFPAGYDSIAYRGSRSTNQGSRTGWKGFCQQAQILYAAQGNDFLWHNAPETVNVYTAEDMRNRWLEHFFRNSSLQRKTLAQITAVLDTFQANGMRCMAGIVAGNSVEDWATSAGPGGSYGTWADVAAAVKTRGMVSSFTVQAARSTSGCYIFWQPEFRDLA